MALFAGIILAAVFLLGPITFVGTASVIGAAGVHDYRVSREIDRWIESGCEGDLNI